MKYYTDLNIYGHISLELSADNETSGAINNVSTANISFLRLTGNAPTVSGFADGADNNKILVVSHAGTGLLTLKNLSSLSSSGNRIITGYDADVTIQAGANVILIYDSYDQVWRILSLQSDVKSITGTANQITVAPTKGDIVLSLPQSINTTSNVTFGEINISGLLPTLNSNSDLVIQASQDINLSPNGTTGVVNINSIKQSTSKTSGSLVVDGGVGVSGNIYGNAIYENNNRVLTSASSIDDLNDVNLSAKQNNYIIGYNSTTQIWEAKSASSIITSTDTLNDVVNRGSTTSLAISLTNTTESTSLITGALTISGGLGVAKRIHTKNLTVNGIKQRAGVSSNLDSGIIDLSAADHLIYSIDQNVDFLADISFNNGTPGEIFYVKIKSNGQQYTWDITNSEIKWPATIAPIASQINKTDMYHFICLSATEYLGTYVFNYT